MGYRHIYWRCPFFQDDRKTEILCEGGYRLEFPDGKDLKRFADEFCVPFGGSDKCPFAKQINERYDQFFKKQEVKKHERKK